MATSKDKIELYDTTLRDGAGAQGISFSIEDKREIFKLLDEYGVDLIEGGYPSSNPKDAAFFAKTDSDKLVAFSSTCKSGCKASEDKGLIELNKVSNKIVCLFGKASVKHVENVLKTTKENNLKMIYDSVKMFADLNKRVIFDAEHFFDAYSSDADYAIEVLRAAEQAGADTLCLCDSNGGTFPSDIGRITKEISKKFSAKIGIHAQAVASTLAAVENGARHVQGTFLGFGERAGNANLSTVVCNLKLKTDYDVDVKIETTTLVGRKIAEIANITLDHSMPYIGKNAFFHKAGNI